MQGDGASVMTLLCLLFRYTIPPLNEKAIRPDFFLLIDLREFFQI